MRIDFFGESIRLKLDGLEGLQDFCFVSRMITAESTELYTTITEIFRHAFNFEVFWNFQSKI